MGWTAGSEIAEDVWTVIRQFIPECERQCVARALINIFASHDADTLEEAEQLWEDAQLE